MPLQEAENSAVEGLFQDPRLLFHSDGIPEKKKITPGNRTLPLLHRIPGKVIR